MAKGSPNDKRESLIEKAAKGRGCTVIVLFIVVALFPPGPNAIWYIGYVPVESN